ncbi:MAG: hypothetical protein LBJ20_02585 [Candidatus Methanoplasma sp.]|jgi:hypothetical protein|nr:hypothetical protein [Candidatus Methanoplasma sp.]
MPNVATIAVGIVVIAVIVFAAYYAYRSLKQGKCAGCGCECSKSSDAQDCCGCQKKDR